MNLNIMKLTEDCPRQDCSVEYHGSTTTLLGFTQTYDRHGNPEHRDPNTSRSNFSCHRCGKQWTVTSRDGMPDQLETYDPTKVSSDAARLAD